MSQREVARVSHNLASFPYRGFISDVLALKAISKLIHSSIVSVHVVTRSRAIYLYAYNKYFIQQGDVNQSISVTTTTAAVVTNDWEARPRGYQHHLAVTLS